MSHLSFYTICHPVRISKKSHTVFCKSCQKSFSIDPYFLNTKVILNDHLDGFSFRTLTRKYKISKSHAWDICHEELKKLPDNNQFPYRYCNRFSKIFLFDGKYFNVASNRYNWVLLWGIDYFRHDIPVFTVATAETYQTWAPYFSYLRILDLHPQLMVCDDHTGLKMEARNAFPAVKIQTCYNHFKENIRRDLRIRSTQGRHYKNFMNRIEFVLSSQKISDHTFNTWMQALYRDYHHDRVCLSIMTNIQKYKQELTAYRGIHQAPVTTNLIEGMNGHLEARLWLNGYILKRRFTKFTDTRGKFMFLRGRTGVNMTKKERVHIPPYF